MTLGPAQDVIECWPGLLLKALAKHNGTYLGLKTLGFPTLVQQVFGNEPEILDTSKLTADQLA